MREMLRQGFKRLINVPEPSRYTLGDRSARVIAISSQKGGVGKTTTAVNLGAALARYHQRATLILDMDPQGHVQTSLNRHTRGHGGQLSKILLSDERDDVLDTIAATSIENLHITPADRFLAETESLISTKLGKEYLLKDALKYTRTHYDFIVIDCPPNLGNLTINALVAADHVLVPCDASPLAIQGVCDIATTMATIDERLHCNINLLGILLTRLDGRNRKVNSAVIDEIKADFGELLLERFIGTDTSLAKSQFEGTTVFDYNEQSRAAKHYRELAAEVLARLA